jgi:hypothetical protein
MTTFLYVHRACADMVCLPMTHFQWGALRRCGATVCFGSEIDAVRPEPGTPIRSLAELRAAGGRLTLASTGAIVTVTRNRSVRFHDGSVATLSRPLVHRIRTWTMSLSKRPDWATAHGSCCS